MTSIPASRRDFACRTSRDDETSPEPEVAMPVLPTPGPAARGILALFGAADAEIAIPAGVLLH